MVLISVIAIIVYRVIMDIDYCPSLDPPECLILTTILSSVLNAISILLLSKVGHSSLSPPILLSKVCHCCRPLFILLLSKVLSKVCHCCQPLFTLLLSKVVDYSCLPPSIFLPKVGQSCLPLSILLSKIGHSCLPLSILLR